MMIMLQIVKSINLCSISFKRGKIELFKLSTYRLSVDHATAVADATINKKKASRMLHYISVTSR